MGLFLHKTLPTTNNNATMVLITGHSFIGRMDVRAPVIRDNPANTISMTADPLQIITETGLDIPSTNIVYSTSKPIKQSVSPSAIHSMRIIRLLSADIDPNPFTTGPVAAR